MKKVAILSIGTELINYNKTDTNSPWLTNKLFEIGCHVTSKHILPDDKEAIARIIKNELDYNDILILIGGLGPTHDDVTVEAVCLALQKNLIFENKIWEHIQKRYKDLGRTPTEDIKKQAYIPATANYFINKYGTAPCIWLNQNNTIIIMLPGPPLEFKYLSEDFVLPRLKELQEEASPTKLFFSTVGLPESKVEELLKPFYQKHPYLHVTLLAIPFQVDIYILIPPNIAKKISEVEKISNEIYSLIGAHIYTNEEEKSLEQVVGDLLLANRKTIAIAESCTGGRLADRITNIAGSSNYFERGIVSYSNNSKIELLGVQPFLINNYGAVSKEVAIAMAEGIRIKSKTDLGLGITGIAGPSGGTNLKPVGTVHIALNSNDYLLHQHYIFKGDRNTIKFATTQAALSLLWHYLINNRK
jgi:nicotinamide-nucleotide amidase